MAGRQLKVDPDALRAASELLGNNADNYKSSLQSLDASVNSGETPWGTDDTGSVFGAVYMEIAHLGTQALAHLGDGLTSLADALGKVADVIEAADEDQSHTYQTAKGQIPQ
jgi:uncharacterized protein YukE